MIAISDKTKCSGCHACAAVCPKQCISMEKDAEGFLYPVADTAYCIQCGLCVRACPILTPLMVQKTEKDITAYAAVNQNADVRLHSSSGGIFSLLAEHVIGQGGVVFGAAFDPDFQVEHRCAETVEALAMFRGAKYVQSRIGNAYSQAEAFLKAGRKVLFTGTPCQIEGLFAYLQKDYENLLTQDIICHGVPSPLVWEKYIRYREEKTDSRTKRITFRHKKESWKRYSVCFEFENDTEYLLSASKDPYMNAFLKDLCLRPSCYTCTFKKKYRLSDFTLADFWGIQHVLPDMDDDKGTSLVLVNSDVGRKVFGVLGDQMKYEAVLLEEGIKYNPSMITAAVLPHNRDAFMNTAKKEDFDVLYRKFLKPSLLKKCLRAGKSIIKKVLK